jgi:hypothetical protein
MIFASKWSDKFFNNISLGKFLNNCSHIIKSWGCLTLVLTVCFIINQYIKELLSHSRLSGFLGQWSFDASMIRGIISSWMQHRPQIWKCPKSTSGGCCKTGVWQIRAHAHRGGYMKWRLVSWRTVHGPTLCHIMTPSRALDKPDNF